MKMRQVSDRYIKGDSRIIGATELRTRSVEASVLIRDIAVRFLNHFGKSLRERGVMKVSVLILLTTLTLRAAKPLRIVDLASLPKNVKKTMK